MTQHTPTPWEIRATTGLHSEVAGLPDKDGNYVPIGYITDPDARFIVKACNNHDALLAACKLVMDNLCWVAPTNGFCEMPAKNFVQIKQAIEKATE